MKALAPAQQSARTQLFCFLICTPSLMFWRNMRNQTITPVQLPRHPRRAGNVQVGPFGDGKDVALAQGPRRALWGRIWSPAAVCSGAVVALGVLQVARTSIIEVPGAGAVEEPLDYLGTWNRSCGGLCFGPRAPSLREDRREDSRQPHADRALLSLAQEQDRDVGSRRVPVASSPQQLRVDAAGSVILMAIRPASKDPSGCI
ncbi:hypothetical protein CB1_000162003 [Camelus ferus]|nr:hypothetical protein CB1_000162003 [Camelus ferus]